MEVVWEVCGFLGPNSKVKWCVFVCDFLAVYDGCGPMRIFFIIFEISCGWKGDV